MGKKNWKRNYKEDKGPITFSITDDISTSTTDWNDESAGIGKPTEDELPELENDLEERLLSARNMIDLAILAFQCGQYELIPTAIEDAYIKVQGLIDDYCVVR